MAETRPSVPKAGHLSPPGARHFAQVHSIGRRSRALKTRHLLGRVWRVMLGVAAVIVAAMAVGLAVGGIGFGGLFATALACVIVAALLARYPRLAAPTREQLAQGSLRDIVGKAELWLETRRPGLPAPALRLVDHIGIQLDALGLQLDQTGDQAGAAEEIRKLVGVHLPGIVASYTAIPAHLRGEAAKGGGAPDAVLVESLAAISAEIDAVTRQLATGAIDDLAIKARYLDYRYGAALDDEPER
ncbi:hypothetical protein ACFOD9_02325 [Novosphingobium bradum]|uniref:5-bromo-4-chloroindolyl phosphate hydrolase n=1 Tax=Novosphingobium bradum TaxID=1737444 RepID=A0ABV7INB8_9SPHN